MRENMARTKEMLLAEWRQGLHELGAALYGPGTAAQSPEYGMPNTKMAIEVAEGQRSGETANDNNPRSILGERLARAQQARDDRGHEPPQLDRE
jgi:hypothetical protein